jgi:hypothetical protein
MPSNSNHGEQGQLQIIIDSKLNYAGDQTKVKVRDQNLRLVRTTRRGKIPLPVGLYEISTLYDNGELASEIVEIKANEETEVKFYLKADTGPDASLTDKDFIRFQTPSDASAKSSNISLVDITHGAQIHARDDRWVIRQENEMEQLTSAIFVSGERVLTINLPVSGGNHFRSMWCQVFANREGHPTYPIVKIAPTRTIASSMEQMLDLGRIFYASQVAGYSMSALLDRYPDPTGALLGVTALFKVGLLYKHKAWLQEFNERYDWLPDGKIFLAALLYESKEDEITAVELIKSAAKQKILYSDSLSILLKLIRALPVEPSEFKSTMNMAPFIDWRSRYLCQLLPRT